MQRCENCQEAMYLDRDDDIHEGVYRCPSCDHVVKEADVTKIGFRRIS